MKTTVRRGEHNLLTFPTHYLWPPSISLPYPLCLHLYPVPSLAPSLLPAPSHLSLPVALITSPLLHHLYYFLLQSTITLFLSCSCSHFSAFCFNHTTTPLPSSVSPIHLHQSFFFLKPLSTSLATHDSLLWSKPISLPPIFFTHSKIFHSLLIIIQLHYFPLPSLHFVVQKGSETDKATLAQTKNFQP